MPGAVKFAPKIDAQLESRTVFRHLAGANRFARSRLGVGVTDTGRGNPAATA
jgi:phthiodiolone/phenolphthiodiolone dimycocerosates ketoreductase